MAVKTEYVIRRHSGIGKKLRKEAKAEAREQIQVLKKRASKIPSKAFKGISKSVKYSPRLSKNLLNSFSGAFRPTPTIKQPSPKQIAQRIKFAQQQKLISQLKQQLQKNSALPIRRPSTSYPTVSPIPPQFQKPQPVGVWARDFNSWANTRNPPDPNHVIWKGRRPTYFYEDGKLKQGGLPESYFN